MLELVGILPGDEPVETILVNESTFQPGATAVEADQVTHAITGKVVEVDSAGNLITDIDAQLLAQAPRDDSVRIVVDEHETFGIYSAEHGQPSMTLIAVLDGSQNLRIELVDDSASAMLGVRVGAAVEVGW